MKQQPNIEREREAVAPEGERTVEREAAPALSVEAIADLDVPELHARNVVGGSSEFACKY